MTQSHGFTSNEMMRTHRVHWKLGVLLLVALATTPLRAFPEPSKTPEWLMNQSVSLFDWGIFKLDEFMDRLSGWYISVGDDGFYAVEDLLKQLGLTHWGGGAKYDWDSNRITLYATVAAEGDLQKDACKTALTAMIEGMLRKAMGKYDRESRQQQGALFLELFFSHEAGIASVNRPKDVGTQLVHITEIAVTMIGRAGPRAEEPLRCTTTFVDDAITYNR